MNTLNNRRALVESAMIAAIASFFVMSLVYIPVLFMLVFLLPVPFMVLATRHNIKYGLFSLIVASLLIGILTDMVFTLFIVIYIGPIALIMGNMIKKRRDEFSVIGIGAAIGIFTIFLSIQLASVVGGFNVIEEISMMLKETVQHQMDALVDMNVQVIDTENFVNYLMVLFPGIIILHSVFMTLINYYVAVSILRRLRFDDAPLPEFMYFQLPSNIILGAFTIMVLSYFTRFFDGMPTDSLLSNVLLIFIFVFFIQGLAFVSFFLKKGKVPTIIGGLIMTLIIFISPLLLFVSMLGLADSLMDIRKIRQK